MKRILLLSVLFAGTLQAATYSGKPEAGAIRQVCDSVARWEITHRSECRHHDLNWTNGALYAGMFEWAEVTGNEEIFDFLMNIGKKNLWRLAVRTYHADDMAVGLGFLKMYRRYGDEAMMLPAAERAHYIATHPYPAPLDKSDELGKNHRWSWCDALFMAPPVFAQLYGITGEPVYLEFLEKEYRGCTDSLYDRTEHLYYRDCMRKAQPEKNGAKQFWARGDGWVFGGIPQVLDALPADYAGREYFLTIFREMAARLVELQDKDGHWHASLLNPAAYPDPENSASAFFCYGLAWGIRNGVLKGKTYRKALEKGWAGLVEGVHPDGMLGYVQPVGAAPQKAAYDKTEVYGTGAFLLAGTEMYKLYGQGRRLFK
ncbi:MAG: glycoside hydrolase family 88 protein [Bacteroidales bacterium]|nr:glycoside hydrolase family 88 protein [Bacteroidales bacterium]